jgi:hypothetical protein
MEQLKIPMSNPFENQDRPQRNTEAHVAQHAAGHRVRKAHLGLLPNWFWSWSGNSDWDSSALTFFESYKFWSTSAYLIPSSLFPVGANSGGHRPHSIRVLANRSSSKTNFGLPHVVGNGGGKRRKMRAGKKNFKNR